jgi:hypothetical protein
MIGACEGGVTVRTAGAVVADPVLFVKTARYSWPLSSTVAVNEKVVAGSPGTLLQVTPPSTDSCHWTAGSGVPEAAALNVTVDPAGTV